MLLVFVTLLAPQDTALPKVLWYGRAPVSMDEFEESFLARSLDHRRRASVAKPSCVGPHEEPQRALLKKEEG